jgi:versiconal hemiacetal acetate esterase
MTESRPILKLTSPLEAVDADPTDARIFTALSPYHCNFPPTYICTCEADPLRDDGTVMEKALRAAG